MRVPGRSFTQVCGRPFLRVKISPGVALFYPVSDFNMLNLNDLRMVSRLHFIRAWGRRAEDPFRGLRAGPVRTSPHFCRDLQLYSRANGRLPKHHRIASDQPAEVSLATSDLYMNRSLMKRKRRKTSLGGRGFSPCAMYRKERALAPEESSSSTIPSALSRAAELPAK